MFKYLAAALIALLPLAGQSASAATVPVIDVPAATADYVGFDGAGDLLVFGAPATAMDLAHSGNLFADLALSFETADPLGTETGMFALWDDAENLVIADLVSIAQSADLLTMFFSGMTGPRATDFQAGIHVSLFFFDPMGLSPLSALTEGSSYDVAMMIEVAPIPLPAGAVLLVSGLGLLMLRRKKQAA